MTAAGSDSESELWREDKDRRAQYRADYLSRSYDLNEGVAEALAYSELDFSSSGIAERVNKTEATVQAYLDDIEDRYGVKVFYARCSSELAVDADLPVSGGKGT